MTIATIWNDIADGALSMIDSLTKPGDPLRMLLADNRDYTCPSEISRIKDVPNNTLAVSDFWCMPILYLVLLAAAPKALSRT